MVSLRGALLGALAFASAALAQSTTTPISRFCPNGGEMCGAVNVPQSGSDTFFQVTGSTAPGWIAMGVGSGMAGALIFVIYPSADGKNVTISARLGSGHVEPQHTSSIQITRLAGSGVSGKTMTANFKCSNCRSWGNGGTLNVASTTQNFIWAAGPGVAIKSDDTSETITQHADNGLFRLNLVTATGGSSSNPFVATTTGGNGNTGNTGTTGDTGNTGTGNDGNGNSNTNTGGSSVVLGLRKADKVLIAHGVIMALTWVILFPLGAAFIRLLSDRIPNAVSWHRTLQLSNVCLAIIGMAMGMWKSSLDQTHFHSFHQYFGVVIVGMLFVQGALGQLHHAEYRRLHRRTGWSYAHIWLGRLVIAFAIINGGIGLGPDLAKASAGQIAAYSIVAVLVVGVYSTLYYFKRRGGQGKGYSSGRV